ncbi:MAG: hypothetical protein DMG40_27720 [Acidobacteria bacterium]|nr:MAG: hypothetical protein DMG40_27720 [Acidobacteriota bacterium]
MLFLHRGRGLPNTETGDYVEFEIVQGSNGPHATTVVVSNDREGLFLGPGNYPPVSFPVNVGGVASDAVL